MRLIKRLVLTTSLLLILLVVCGLGLLYAMFGNGSGGFLMIPQDCILLERDISGRIQDKEQQEVIGANIHIEAGFSKGFEAGKVDINLKTDKNGQFYAKNISVFACDIINFQVTANGFSEKKLSFVAAQEVQSGISDLDPEGYGSAQYAIELTKGYLPVLPRQIVIELP